MAGPILRLKDLMVHTGLSRSAIYDRMDKKSPRYAEDFPKSFSLSGGAIGWFKNEVDAWLEACATIAKSGAPSKKTKPSPNSLNLAAQAQSTRRELTESLKPVQKSSQHPRSAPKIATSQSPSTRPARRGNLAESIAEGGKINNLILHYLQMKTWTPAMGALLISGIDPLLDCNEIPDGGIGLDEKPLHTSNGRFYEARRIFKEWHEWKDDSGDPAVEMEPLRFLEWCMREDITTEWLLLFLELVGFSDEKAVDLTASRFALLTSR